jgi:hypothetical protein
MASEPPFFVLEPESDGPYDTDCLNEMGFKVGDAPRCPRCGGYVGGLDLLPPVRVELELYGRSPGDFTQTPGGDVVVSERFADAFRSAQLTGAVGFEPVEIFKVARKRGPRKVAAVPRYTLMKVCLGRAAIDEASSRMRRSRPLQCGECRSPGVDGIYGFKLEPGTWQGEDVFRPRGLQSRLVVSERFARFVKDHAITNARLTPTEQVWWDPLGKGPPGPPPPQPAGP